MHKRAASYPDGVPNATEVGDIGSRARSVRSSRSGRASHTKTALLHQILTAAAEASPTREAVRYEGRSLTYTELDEWSSRIARVLIARGIGTEDRVIVAMPRSIESIVSVWAIVKTGAAFVPVDPNYPAARIAHMLWDSKPQIGLTLSKLYHSLPESIPWLTLDGDEGEKLIQSFPAEPIAFEERIRPVRPAHAAWVIYTSGSTGTPKGVVVTHLGLTSLLAEQTKKYQVAPQSKTAHFASPSFDASLLELLLAVARGSTMVIVPPWVYGGDELNQILETEKVSHLFVTPSVLATLDPSRLSRVEVLAVGGEPLPKNLVSDWSRGRRLLNVYGPTETTITTNLSPPLCDSSGVSVGKPNPGMRAYILDRRMNPVPEGVTGELYLSGPQLARGYQGRSDQTSERFVADPFTGSGGRMYRTGDLARWTVDHSVEIRGRTDAQIKIRGFRIEPAEIDSVLGSHPDVQFSVTVPTNAPSGEVVIASYIKWASNTEARPAELKSFLRQQLPRHMVPSIFVELENIPLSPTGKIDKAALPAPIIPSPNYEPPRSPVEKAVASAFALTLGLERVGLDDDFFDLGGTSLLATKAISAIRLTTEFEVRVPWLIAEPNVKALAARITTENRVSPTSTSDSERMLERVVLLREGEGVPLFCVHPMSGLGWSYSRLASTLDHDGPIFGIQTVALDEEFPLPESIDDLAYEYAQWVRRLAPAGACHLLGWSLGGVIAHSMAVQLQRCEYEVATLTLLDSHLRTDPASSARNLAGEFEILGVPFKDGADSEQPPLQTSQALSMLAKSHQIELTTAQAARMLTMAARAASMINLHVPSIYLGDVLFFSASAGRIDPSEVLTQWAEYISGAIRHRPIPVHHNELTGISAVASIATPLSDWLDTGRRSCTRGRIDIPHSTANGTSK